MKQHLSRVDAIARQINPLLVVVAIGLGVLDITLTCVLKLPAMVESAAATYHGVAERKAVVPPAQVPKLPYGH
jgi:hypothetical protein